MRLLFLVIAIASALALGFYLGSRSVPARALTLEPYEGLGSGVLKHGTVLREDYTGPDSISGNLDIKGVYILKEQ